MTIEHDNQYQSWGAVDRQVREVAGIEGFAQGHDGQTFLPFGNGRSYGDSCHNGQGTLLATQTNAQIHHFDPKTGVMVADAGVLLHDVIKRVIHYGYFLSVTPGTSYVTLGGAIANDVHGKNHHRQGTFANSVISFDLLRSDKSELLTCSKAKNKKLFKATIGGMGLTGIITTVKIQLMRVSSANIAQTSIRFKNIDGFFDHVDGCDQDHEYCVAWIDQLASGLSLGRGVLLAGNHAPSDVADDAYPSGAKLSVPVRPPVSLINRWSLSAFNFAYFHKFNAGRSQDCVPWQSYFYPLDAIGGWNKLYGPKGLYQHQSVYPRQGARETTIKLLECAKKHKHASFLTVLKQFGDYQSPGLLSFPRPGFTLTLDFANQGEGTLKLLDELDEIVISAGGAVNPYKDQRMSPHTFEHSFNAWREVEKLRDPRILSDFWQRTALKLSPHNNSLRQELSGDNSNFIQKLDAI